MRILLAAKTMGVGGLERIVVGLARELQNRGHTVWVVSSGGNLVDELQRAGSTHISAPFEITSPLAVAQASRLIRRLIVEHHIDLFAFGCRRYGLNPTDHRKHCRFRCHLLVSEEIRLRRIELQ